MNAIFEQLGGRKFAFLIVLTILFGVLAATKSISVEELKNFLIWAYALFVVGNVSEKFTPKK